MALEKSVLLEKQFAEFGKSISLYCNIISKLDSDPHQGMILRKKGFSLPYIAILDAKGQLLTPHRGPNTVQGFQDSVRQAEKVAKELSDLEKRFADGDVEAGSTLLERRLDLRHFSADVAGKKLEKFKGLDSKRRAHLKALVGRAAYGELFAAHVGKTISTAKAIARYRKLIKSGAKPAPTEAATFWYLLAQDSLARKDLRSFETAIEHMKSLEVDDPQLTQHIESAIGQLQSEAAAGS